ncbi:MAG: glutamate 5-kinase, partial [Propionibacteriaceae bacterium]|nr:glutamate 5-kinase [Propionibacteriaceae bacterium]
MTMNEAEADIRAAIATAKRIVVKVGSSSLTTAHRLDHDKLLALVDALATQHGMGRQVVLVSSGAIA